MANSAKPPSRDLEKIDRIVRALPDNLRPDQLAQRLGEDLVMFRESESLAEQFLLQLRQRYRTKWDAEMLRRATEVVQADMSFMEALLAHDVLRTTIHTKRATSLLDEENKRRKAEHENEELRRAEQQKEERHRREKELEDRDHEAKVLAKDLEIAELKIKLKRSRDDPQEKRSFAEQQKEQLSRLVENAEVRISSLIEFYRFCDEIAERCKQANLKPGDDVYEHIMNLLDGIRDRLTK